MSAPPDDGGDDALRWKYERLLQLSEHMRHVIVALRDLVPKAFQEGFRLRVPPADGQPEEPWLVDWLQSETKRTLDRVMPRPPGGPPRSEPEGS